MNGSELGSSKPKEWDQFDVNAKKFGVKNTYHEILYTTPIPSDLTEEQRLNAARIAGEIEADIASNPHQREERGQERADGFGDDEEARYGAVTGSGRYGAVIGGGGGGGGGGVGGGGKQQPVF